MTLAMLLSSLLRQTVRARLIGARRPSKAPMTLLGNSPLELLCCCLALYSGGCRGVQRAHPMFRCPILREIVDRQAMGESRCHPCIRIPAGGTFRAA
jgi:hypothetical protein